MNYHLFFKKLYFHLTQKIVFNKKLSNQMTQEIGRMSQYANLTTPLAINQIAVELGKYIGQMKNRQLPYSVTGNYSNKRKFFYIQASLYKCYYLDMEFPYFLQYKKKKFNWNAFKNEFGSAEIQVYLDLCQRN